MSLLGTSIPALSQGAAEIGTNAVGTTSLQTAAQAAAKTAVQVAAKATAINRADTAWMLICTVLVMLITIPGIILFYGGMLRSKNALSIVAHTVEGAAVVTLVWALVAYSIASSSGNGYCGASAWRGRWPSVRPTA